MNKQEKIELVQQLQADFTASGSIVVAQYKGLTVSEMSDLRSTTRQNGVKVRVVKNTLARIACGHANKSVLSDVLSGQTVLLYSDDPVAAPKIVYDYAKKNNKLVILGGVLDQVFLDQDAVGKLAQLPSLDELRGKIVGLLSAPATKIVRTLLEPATQVSRVIKAYSEKNA